VPIETARIRPSMKRCAESREWHSRGRWSSRRAASVATLLLFTVALLSAPSPANATTKPAERVAFSRELRRRQAQCLRHDDCRDASHDEGYSEDCELRCISPACHNQVYADDPLEEGEIDLGRTLRFKACIAREMKNMARKTRLEKGRKQNPD
jgi:hypothetical protein